MCFISSRTAHGGHCEPRIFNASICYAARFLMRHRLMFVMVAIDYLSYRIGFWDHIQLLSTFLYIYPPFLTNRTVPGSNILGDYTHLAVITQIAWHAMKKRYGSWEGELGILIFRFAIECVLETQYGCS
jgi:hypothetical protein